MAPVLCRSEGPSVDVDMGISFRIDRGMRHEGAGFYAAGNRPVRPERVIADQGCPLLPPHSKAIDASPAAIFQRRFSCTRQTLNA
jgi:hypothetical protein